MKNLLNISDIFSTIKPVPGPIAPLQIIAKWCVDYLCRPHADIGRSGVVCPWSPAAIKKETFWLTEVKALNRDDAQIAEEMLGLIDVIKQKGPQAGEGTQFKTIVAVFPDIYPIERIAELHTILKPSFLQSGLMLGEFFETCEKAGLRSATFRPLQSPIPLLVIREMVEFDIAFLCDDHNHVAAYLRHHQTRGMNAIKQLLGKSEKLGLDGNQISVLASFTR